jgi:hypothetical protein
MRLACDDQFYHYDTFAKENLQDWYLFIRAILPLEPSLSVAGHIGMPYLHVSYQTFSFAGLFTLLLLCSMDCSRICIIDQQPIVSGLTCTKRVIVILMIHNRH